MQYTFVEGGSFGGNLKEEREKRTKKFITNGVKELKWHLLGL